MTRRISRQQHEKEARLIEGMYRKNRRIQGELYAYCSTYFWENYSGIFFADQECATEILQCAFIAFWENIEQRKIYVTNGTVMGRDNAPLKCSILTYFMGIARIKYKEWVRDKPYYTNDEGSMERFQHKEGIDEQEYVSILYESDANDMFNIVADVIAHMSERCSQILSKFYYEKKDLDTILTEISTINTKEALKSKKHKCMESLRISARNIYNTYLNS